MKKEYIIQSIEMLLDKNHLDDSSVMSILLTMLQRYNDNDAETEVNPLLERLDKVRQQEEYARQLQKDTDNKEFNLVYDKVKKIDRILWAKITKNLVIII